MQKKTIVNIALLVAIAVCLIVTTAATIITYDKTEIGFKTGEISININDGKSIFEDGDFMFTPGATVKKDFFIKNEGELDAYYKIYLTDVAGDLADVVDVKIKNGSKILYSGSPSELNRSNVKAADDIIVSNEKKVLQIEISIPKNVDNKYQSKDFNFKLSATATQVKNNDGKEF